MTFEDGLRGNVGPKIEQLFIRYRYNYDSLKTELHDVISCAPYSSF